MLPSSFWPKALYIHVPFCTSRCPYCDFFTRISKPHEHLAFVRRCIEQLDSYLSQRPDLLCGLKTIFLGGGTPGLLAPKALEDLFRALYERLPQQISEITLESNPELIQAESLALWRSLGIQRLSVGLQSQNDSLLKFLGRRSSKAMHEKLLPRIQKYLQCSCDFIYGIPGQTQNDIAESLDFIARHRPEHISYYELGIEEGTLFAKWRAQGRLKPSEESEDQFYQILEGLQDLGYQRYEVSNFARAGAICEHNSHYWRWQPYLGLGPSAVGAGILPDEGRVWRSQGTRNWHSYMSEPDFGVRNTTLEPRESLWEYLLMALRLREGIDVEEFCILFRQAGRQQMEDLLKQSFPQTMAEYGHFFQWRENGAKRIFLQLDERGFNLQGALLRKAYSEI